MRKFKDALDSQGPSLGAWLRGKVSRGSRGAEKLNEELRRASSRAGLENGRYVEIVLSELVICAGDLLTAKPDVGDCVQTVE